MLTELVKCPFFFFVEEHKENENQATDFLKIREKFEKRIQNVSLLIRMFLKKRRLHRISPLIVFDT